MEFGGNLSPTTCEKIKPPSQLIKCVDKTIENDRVFNGYNKDKKRAVRCKFVDASAVFIDAMHIKASANK